MAIKVNTATRVPYENSPDGTDPGNGYGYPVEVPWSKIENFLRDIGVDPIDRETILAIHIEPRGLVIERARVREDRDGRRHKYATGDGLDIAVQITNCRIVWAE